MNSECTHFPSLAATCIFSLSALAGASTAIVADFSGGGVPEGWTVGDGAYRSPAYAGPVDRIELRYSAGAASGAAHVYASSNQVDELSIAAFTAASSAAAFDFPEETDFRSFRIATEGGLALLSFSAYVSPSTLDAPAGVAISNNTTGTSFDAEWNPVAEATGYRVYVWTNAVVGASAGTAIWSEALPGATNVSSNTRMTDDKFNACFENEGWTRSADKAGYSTGEDGTVRIGTSEGNGWLQTPPINSSSGGMAVRFHAKANAANTRSMDIDVERVSDGVASLAGMATLATGMQEFTVELHEWKSGDSVRFNSLTSGDRRTIIGSVEIVSGYSRGTEEPQYIVDGRDVGGATSCRLSDLPPVPVRFAVDAYGKRGAASAKTEAVTVDLSNPDKVAVLDACPISSLVGYVYAQDFDSLAEATATTGDKNWLNGTTLRYWQAHKGADAATSFKYNGGNGPTGGLYALSARQEDSGRALGAYSTRNDEYSFGILFTNDTGVAMVPVSVEYLAQQWGFRNDANQTLSVSAKVVDGLCWISSSADGWTELASSQSGVYGEGVAHDTPVSESVDVGPDPAVSVAPGQVLMLKWTVHSLKSGTAGMMGIDNVVVTFADALSLKRGFSIRIAGGAAVQTPPLQEGD